ncbi:MAG: FHA domain-containing protein [Gemmatimonadota bacterium]|nr:MAG: FHA domain-containing protein [Gemmatimonadota bacterium]
MSEAQSFEQSFSIGRDSANDVTIDDPRVSLRHAEVSLQDGQWFIRDLGSSNGTFVDGDRVERTRLSGTKQVRLGFKGPRLEVFVGAALGAARRTVMSEPSESQVINRLLGEVPPEDMSRHTRILRRALRKDRSRLARRYLLALAAITAVAVIAMMVAYAQRKQLERARIAAADVFYQMKALELEVDRLQLDSAETREYRRRQEEMRQTYLDYLEQLGVYGENTPEDEQLIYQVIHRFGESEANVPREFVREVKRYIERWRSSGRLADAVSRSRENGYAPTIVDIMLQHNMPPEFFYLGVQESGLKLEAVGRQTRYGIAKGPWQLMPETARAYGVRIGPLVGVPRYDPEDDRHQLEISTHVAARHLRFIYTTDAQASGLLVMASYNWGQGNVVPLIQAMPENPRERNFWTLLDQHGDRIPAETYGYVFNIVSAAAIGENPALFGFDFEPLSLRTSIAETAETEPTS